MKVVELLIFNESLTDFCEILCSYLKVVHSTAAEKSTIIQTVEEKMIFICSPPVQTTTEITTVFSCLVASVGSLPVMYVVQYTTQLSNKQNHLVLLCHLSAS